MHWNEDLYKKVIISRKICWVSPLENTRGITIQSLFVCKGVAILTIFTEFPFSVVFDNKAITKSLASTTLVEGSTFHVLGLVIVACFIWDSFVMCILVHTSHAATMAGPCVSCNILS